MITKLGGRKFIVTLLAILLGFVLVLMDKLPATEYLAFIVGTGAIYSVANVTSKLADNQNGLKTMPD